MTPEKIQFLLTFPGDCIEKGLQSDIGSPELSPPSGGNFER